MMKETVIQYFSWLSWRRPWVWLVALFLMYHLTLAVVAPMLIKSKLNELVVERLQLNLDVDGISINPYEFTLTINQLKISGNDLGQPLGFDKLFINLQPWDSFGDSWSIKEAYLTGLYGEFKRIDAKTNNFTRILNNWMASATATDESASSTSSTLPLRIEDIKLQIAQLKIVDQLPKSRFETDLGPIEFQAHQFNTLPNATGNQSLLLKTNTGVELSWQGNFRLAPFSSEGDVNLVGPALTTLADYLKDDFKVAVATSKLQVQFHYALNKPEQSDLTVLLSGIEANLQDLKVNQLAGNSPLLALKQVNLAGGEIKWPEASVQLPKIQLRDGEAWATISPQGQLNFEQVIAERGSANSEPSPWQVVNELLSINGLNLHYRDESIGTNSQVEIENIAMELKNLSTRAQQNSEASASFSLQGGKFESTAKFQLNPFANAEGTYKITQLPAKAAQSFVEAYARVDITEGELAAEGKITSAEEAIKIQGNAQLNNIKVQEKASGKTLLSWSTLKLNRIIADVEAKKINIGRMGFNEAFADFNIFSDGTHTLTRVLTTPAATAQESTTADTSSNFTYLIGRIDVENASGKFTDSSLPLPFSADIAHINGTISTLDSTSHSPANVKLEGQVSDYGEMVMTGEIFPLEPTQKTRMNLSFNNIDISELSPYAIKFAGREIAKGKMDLDLKYDINQDQMLGQNNVVLHEFALGKKVAQPGAADLPLDLAVALLKDKDGIIRADLPVQGNINDPKFDYGKTLRKAIRKLITNVAAAPFRFLAGLVGVGKNKDLGYISFFAGRTDLSPAQTEKVNQIGEALIKRPDLQIDIPGVYSVSFDTHALQEQKFETRLREQLSQSQSDANIGSRKYISTLENLYTEAHLSPSLDALKNAAQATTGNEDNADQLSYARTIKEKLVAIEAVSQADLLQLANQRAQVVYGQLAKISGIKATQIKLAVAREGGINKDNKLKLELGANLKKTKKKKINI
ncbi:DUF748 domain-containing protein [Cellvibrio sp. KY-GH-1]|uniref:DUF748 domain-containing protein n=1 Tax=Cellvibrio sp. KY-GH-1 TaxID=2303332 RepID=UPI001248AAF1|nr:DUF748 domain-containing protein [Cellvibrio sp. KY-GH-1]QEY18297.1 DUF748 domain-containing protein [Cellvibrio sp. KY-GH-1]